MSEYLQRDGGCNHHPVLQPFLRPVLVPGGQGVDGQKGGDYKDDENL